MIARFKATPQLLRLCSYYAGYPVQYELLSDLTFQIDAAWRGAARRGAASLHYRNRAKGTRTEETIFGMVYSPAQKLSGLCELSLRKTATVNVYSYVHLHGKITSTN